MPRTAMIEREAFEVVKAMQTDGLDLGRGLPPSGPPGFGGDRGRGSVARQPRRRRRARSPQRHLLPQLAERAWRHRAEDPAHPRSGLRDRELRPARSGDRPRDPGRLRAGAVHPQGRRDLLLGRPIAPTTVSRVTLDAAFEARRPLTNGYKALMGVVLSRKTGVGAPPSAGSPRPASRRQDYRLPPGESAAERFLDDLYARGLTGEGLETICVDGGQGLLAAPAYHGIPVQRCRAHKIRPRQGSQSRSGRRQAGSPRCQERRQSHQGPERRQPQTLGRCIPQGRRLPARRSRRSADLLPGPRSTQTDQDHQRYRAMGGPTKNPPYGRFPGPHLDGPHPDLHPREQTAGNQYPLTYKS